MSPLLWDPDGDPPRRRPGWDAWAAVRNAIVPAVVLWTLILAALAIILEVCR